MKLTNFLIAVVFLFFVNASKAQVNLVPNPSFELYDTCPDNEGQISRAIGWSIYGNHWVSDATPDYYNACDTGQWNVPNGLLIHQNAYDGYAFAAIITYVSNNIYREYIGIQLSQPLVVGVKYYLSFHTSLGEVLGLNCPTNNIGMLLSTTSYSTIHPLSIVDFSHLKSDSIISDTTNWTFVSGSIVADSAYEFLILGNFYSNTNTDTISLGGNHFEGYYGLDNICISTDSLTCNPLTLIPNIDNSPVIIFPNPFSSELNINFKNEADKQISIFDVLGNLMYTNEFYGDAEINISVNFLLQGYYLLIVYDKQNLIAFQKKILKL